jgi:hypothetical protein
MTLETLPSASSYSIGNVAPAAISQLKGARSQS